MATFNEIGSGGVVLNGIGSFLQTRDEFYEAEGGVDVEGAEADLQFVFFVNPIFLWEIDAFLIRDVTFLWGIGSQQILWYRLVGKGKDNGCDPIDVEREPCCQKYIMNIHARSVKELCEKLQGRRWKWPIESVEVWSKPALVDDIALDESEGINHDCDITTLIDVCETPECAEFCIDVEFTEQVALQFGASRQEFFTYEGSGDIFIGGTSPSEFEAEGVAIEEGSGGIEGSGVADESVGNVGPGHWFYIGDGEIIIGGEAEDMSSAYQYEGDGAVFILGSAETNFILLGAFTESVAMNMLVSDFIVAFGDDADLQNLVAPTGTVNQCTCPQLPFQMQFGYNFIQSNVFAQFLQRNSLTAPSVLDMTYNAINNTWQSNLFYVGISADSDLAESWNLVFELECTNEVGGTELGLDVWKASIQVFRKNLVTLEDFDTRILVAILPDTVCSSTELDFTVNYDTQSDIATVRPNSTIYQNIIYDDIGLFKTAFWLDNPILVLQLTQIGIDIDQLRVVYSTVYNPI